MKKERATAAIVGAVVTIASAVTAFGLTKVNTLDPKFGEATHSSALATGPSPAQAALDAVMAQVAPGQPVSDAVVSPVGSQACTDGAAVAVPVLARSVTTSAGQVTLSVYRAGIGAPAYTGQRDLLTGCDRVRTQPVDGLGVQGLRADLGASHAVVWRRVDVVASVVTTGSIDPAVGARDVDEALTPAMTTCAEQDSHVSDAARSPFAPVKFTGLVKEFTVTVPADTRAQLVPVDGPEVSLPVVTVPERPDGPVWPETLPAPVARPSVPEAPQLPPLEASFRERVDDPTGPGCGWAFLRESKPPFDVVMGDRLVADQRSRALAQLQAGAAAYLAAAQTYRSALEGFDAAAQQYRDYAAQVEQVAAAWEKIRTEQDEYQQALAVHQRAVTELEQFTTRREAAQRDYDAAVAACQGARPDPAPTGMPTPGTPTETIPVPAPTGLPDPGQTLPVPTFPAPTGTLSDHGPDPRMAKVLGPSVTAPARVCPPPRPSILDEPAPTVPPVPTPPADPRPESNR